ncbi:hypothetical protein IEO70_09160 [Bacillus sp. AGMB 02131]|uniref:Group-specific protein n=1 Tax=Peribacillus faecalis TaxID=2772559 RepID=A0A927CWU8_9BACI|nr:hypothetical protein [Peribacillus faecalis]MBD3108536.1 hypothetical protein [Peribacillus faecalis]
MYKKITPGVKISISRSISTAFEQYMKSIQWGENQADIVEFVANWKGYITSDASWYAKVDESVKEDPAFHKELAAKINQTIDKILNEKPTEEQMNLIELLQEQTNSEEYMYSCRAEARYIIEKLQEELEADDKKEAM